MFTATGWPHLAPQNFQHGHPVIETIAHHSAFVSRFYDKRFSREKEVDCDTYIHSELFAYDKRRDNSQMVFRATKFQLFIFYNQQNLKRFFFLLEAVSPLCFSTIMCLYLICVLWAVCCLDPLMLSLPSSSDHHCCISFYIISCIYFEILSMEASKLYL